MKVSKIRTWLKRIPAGAQHVQLAVDGISGLTDVATWERSDVEDRDADEESDVAASIIEQAQEWADGEREPCKFSIRWMSEKGRALRVATHRATPTAIEETTEGQEESGLTTIEDLPAAMLALIRDLGRRDTEKDKQMVKVLVTSTTAYDKTISMLTAQLQSAYRQLAERHGVPEVAVPLDLTPEQREEVIQRAKALEAFTGKVPDIIDLILAALANKYLPDADGAGREADSGTEH